MPFVCYSFDEPDEAHWRAYRRLWECCAQANPYLAPAWLRAWLASDRAGRRRRVSRAQRGRLGSVLPYAYLVLEEEGEWKICLPVCIMENALGSFLWPMAADTNDVSDFLFASDCSSQMKGEWMTGLAQWLRPYRALWLPLLSQEFAVAWASLRFSNAWSVLRRRSESLSLGVSSVETVEDFYSSKALKRMRYVQRQWDVLGDWSVRLCTLTDWEEQKILSSMMRLEERITQRDQRQGVFSRDGAQEFYEGALPTMIEEGLLELWCLRLSGNLVAYQILLRRGGDWYLHATSYQADFAKYSPGAFLQWRVLQQLTQGGACRFCWMQGSHDYKLRLANHCGHWWDLCLFPRTGRGAVAYGVFQWMRVSIWLISSCKKLLSPAKR